MNMHWIALCVDLCQVYAHLKINTIVLANNLKYYKVSKVPNKKIRQNSLEINNLVDHKQ